MGGARMTLAERERRAREIRQLIDRIAQLSMPREELLECLDSPNALVRVNAILAVAYLGLADDEVLLKLREMGSRKDRERPVIGLFTVAMFAIAALSWLDTPASHAMYEQLARELDPVTRGDLEELVRGAPYKDCFRR